MKNRILSLSIILILSILVLWLLCPAVARNLSAGKGHIPSNEPNSPSPITPSPIFTSIPTKEPKPLYNYYTITENKPDLDLSMHVLEVDPTNTELMIRPVTSHKTLFGYKYLSEINKAWQAEASVNAGFSYSNGLLGGFFAIDGELLTPASGNYPILFFKEGKAFIENAKTRIWVEGDGVILDDVYFNRYSDKEGIYVFTPSYGTGNRIKQRHLNALISDGEVRGLIIRNKSYEIPSQGFLISAIGKDAEAKLDSLIKPGMMLKLKYEVVNGINKISDYDWGYECGSWIIKNSEIIAPTSDGWVGTLQTRVPRTAVGIKEDGTLIFVVVDGRQKGLSDGLSLKELGQKLLELGVKDAVNLDGGASSEMIIEGQIVNSPSAGRERMLACGFIIKKK